MCVDWVTLVLAGQQTGQGCFEGLRAGGRSIMLTFFSSGHERKTILQRSICLADFLQALALPGKKIYLYISAALAPSFT